MGHSCSTLLWDTLMGHSCGTLLRDTLEGNSCGTVAGHSCGTLIRDTLVGHLSGTLGLAGHSFGTFLIPQIIPLASDTLRLRQPVSRSPVARRHANALPTKAAQIPMALQHHERNFATRSAGLPIRDKQTYHMIPQIIPLTTDTPRLRQPSGMALRVRTFHQGRANPNGTATSRTSCRQTICPYSKHVTANHPAHQRHAAFTPACSALPTKTRPHANALSTKAAQIPMALRHHERPLATRSAHMHTRSSHASVSYETSSKSHASRLQDERFVRGFLQKSQVSKTGVSYETSSKSHASSLQNERFVRDFLQKSHVKSPKRAFRTRLPQKVTRQVSKTSVSYEHTHHAALPSSFAIPAPPNNTRTLANPNVTTTFIPQLTQPHHSLRLANLSASTRLTRTKHCACHEMSPPSHLATSRFPAPATKIALPHLKTRTTFNKICTTPHVWSDFDPF